MVSKKQKNLFNYFDKLIFIYLTPLFIWALSMFSFFSGQQKFVLVFIFLVIVIGIEFLLQDLSSTPKNKYRNKMRSIDDVQINFQILFNPTIFITCILSYTIAGLIGFYFLGHTLFSFISFGSMAFVIILGIEFFFQDLFVDKYKINSNNIILFLYRKFNILLFIKKYYYPVITGSFGFFLIYSFYLKDLFSLLFGTILFIFIGLSLKNLK